MKMIITKINSANFVMVSIVIILLTSCHKFSNPVEGYPNKPPVANAGVDKFITLPQDTAILDGTASFDVNNNIVSYQWNKISGPASFTITDPPLSRTSIINLVQGIYEFELKVTDAKGEFSTDTIKVTVDYWLYLNNLTWNYSWIDDRYFMQSPDLTAYQINNVRLVNILYSNMPPYGISSWQNLTKDGTTPDIFFYKIENKKVIVYMYNGNGYFNWISQYAGNQMRILFY